MGIAVVDMIFIKAGTRENRTKKYLYEQCLYVQLYISAFDNPGE